MSRKKIVAGNWKMNKTALEAGNLIREILEGLAGMDMDIDTRVVMAPPFPYLVNAVDSVGVAGIGNVYVAAQNCHQEESGAFTGEVSPMMLNSIGVDFVIVGHSERRQYFEEDNALIARKVDAVLNNGMRPIFCCGEPLEIREKDAHLEFIQLQLEESLFHLDHQGIEEVVIAYEPVWAIGTGLTAEPHQAEEVHAFIRGIIGENYGFELADRMTILYGGSCKPSNAEELFSQENVDGGLIGGASLDAGDFLAIINALNP